MRVAQGQLHGFQDSRLDIFQASHILPSHVWHLRTRWMRVNKMLSEGLPSIL